jgi:hypothetical protein
LGVSGHFEGKSPVVVVGQCLALVGKFLEIHAGQLLFEENGLAEFTINDFPFLIFM